MRTKRETIRLAVAVCSLLLGVTLASVVFSAVSLAAPVVLAGVGAVKNWPLAVLFGAGAVGMVRNVAMETLMGYTTAPGTTDTAVTIGTDQSLTIRQGGDKTNRDTWPIIIEAAHVEQEAVPIMKVKAASFGENNVGLQLRSTINVARPLWAGVPRPVAPNDTLTWTLQGSTTAGNIGHGLLWLFYRQSPTQQALLIDWMELGRYAVDVVSAENTISSGTTGQFSGGENFHAEQNPFKPETHYAIVGNLQQTADPIAGVFYKHPQSANLKVGIPGSTDNRITRRFFADLSFRTGLKTISVFYSAGLGNTTIDCAVNENGADPLVTTYYVELSKQFDRDLAAGLI